MDDLQTDEVSGKSHKRRLRLLIAYDGRPFQGWQSQAHRGTVQDCLETAFSTLCGGQKITVHGSGRTDAGVHARGQVAHADVPSTWRHDTAQSRAASQRQPAADDPRRADTVCPGFLPPRFSARGKVYRYRVWNDPVLDPLEIGRAWHFPGDLDDSLLHQAAQRVVGQHDFAAFAANRDKPVTTTVRTIRRVDVRRRGALLTFDFEGDGFLYKMVRLLTGSLIRCAQGRATTQWLDGLLAGMGKTSFAAPAEGLYLMRVLYADRAIEKPVTGSVPPPLARTPPPPANPPAPPGRRTARP